ncbi:MAG TPA: hypothetical protein VGW34_05805 [Allosphingosinicella sp.]|nr:hypothetical protein [Allosphingosinicella sp.]
MKLAHACECLWKTMLKGLAEPSGRFQEKVSPPLSGFGPQFHEEGKSSASMLWIAGTSFANPRASAAAPMSSCLQNQAEPINPGIRPSATFIRLSYNKISR